MSWYNNPYYHPETQGLVRVATADLAEADYSFDYLVAWADADNPDQFYLGTDSGCSCPSPFEDYSGREDMTGPLTWRQAVEESVSIWTQSYDYCYDPVGFADYLRSIVAHAKGDDE